jgi:hypothetical protein
VGCLLEERKILGIQSYCVEMEERKVSNLVVGRFGLNSFLFEKGEKEMVEMLIELVDN